jgi:nucleoside-triphosphatase THEP1
MAEACQPLPRAHEDCPLLAEPGTKWVTCAGTIARVGDAARAGKAPVFIVVAVHDRNYSLDASVSGEDPRTGQRYGFKMSDLDVVWRLDTGERERVVRGLTGTKSTSDRVNLGITKLRRIKVQAARRQLQARTAIIDSIERAELEDSSLRRWLVETLDDGLRR